MDDSHGHVTRLLARITSGDPGAADELLGLLGDELHRLAEQHMRRQPAHHLLSPTALVSEAWVKLARHLDSDWSGRKHFICFASLAMRSVLVDYARKGQLPQETPTTFADLPAEEVSDHAMNALDAAVMLERLAAFDETGAKVVTMRCFSDASNRDIAEVLGASERTVARHWLDARAWLHREFSRDGHGR